MNGIGNWFRQALARFSAGYRRFMTGRYGTDKLNMAILTAGVVVCLVALFVKSVIPNLCLITVSYGLMIWAVCRTLSRNTYKRHQENRRYLMFLDRIKDREHRYFTCPRCHQPVRVPRNKGKIAITCPKCREKFIKKT